MSYFNNFPAMLYGFNIDKKEVLLRVVDIALNVRARQQALQEITLFDEYDIEDGETFESISEKLYGDPKHHWILMLVNERFDYINDFPRSREDLDKYVAAKYGEVHMYDQHTIGGNLHYEDVHGNIATPLTLDMWIARNPGIPVSDRPQYYQNYLNGFKTISNHEWEARLNEKLRRIKVASPAVVDQISAQLSDLFTPA